MGIKIENTQVFGWEAAIRGARNPMNSVEYKEATYPQRLGICRTRSFGCREKR